MISGDQLGTQPVLVLLTESPSQKNMMNNGSQQGTGRDHRMFNKDHNPNSSRHSHGSEMSASCVLQSASEPSGSNRTSVEVITDASTPSSATATAASSRKSVSFEEVSPFSSYANLAAFDVTEYRRCSEDGPASGGAGAAGGNQFANSTKKKNRHQKAQTEHQCMLGVDSQATSAPMGTLEDASTAATTAERLRILKTAITNNNIKNMQQQQQQQQPQTAAQRLRSQTSSNLNNAGTPASLGRRASSPLPTETSNYFQDARGEAGLSTQQQDLNNGGSGSGGGISGTSPPPPAPPSDLLRDFGEAYGAHLVSPRHSIDHSSSLSTSSSSSHLNNHGSSHRNSFNSIGSSIGVPSHSSYTTTGPTSRSSFDVLLGTSANSTPSRQSLDLLQDLLAAVGTAGVAGLRGGSGGGSRASFDSFNTSTPRSSAPVFTTSGAATTGGKKAAHRLSAAGHLENARLAMTTSHLSLDRTTERSRSIIDNALLTSNSTNNTAAIMEHRYPSSSEMLSPSALRALADSSMSVTVVAAPTKRSYAPAAAGPSVGAMASGLIDHYIPIPAGGGGGGGTAGGDSVSTPPRNGGGAVLGSTTQQGIGSGYANYLYTSTTGAPNSPGGGGGAIGGVISPRGGMTVTSTTTNTTTRLSQQAANLAPGHVAPPALLDADLHDTFGAHAWYCGPAISVSGNRTNTNTGTRTMRDATAAAGAGGISGRSSNGMSSVANTSSGRYALGATSDNNHFTSNGVRKSGDGVNTRNGQTNTELRGGDDRSGGGGECGKRYSGGMAAAVAANDSSSAYSAAGTVLAGQQQQQQRHLGGNRGTAKHLELTSMPGQHSVTLHDAQCIVPSYEFLRQRRLAKAQQAKEGDQYWSGGYIAEAKRVLNEAMGTASRQEAENRDSSYSGAIGPLLRHLTAAAGDNEKSRSALHTLGLLVSNLPNRGIIAELQGRHTLAAVLRLCTALDVREQAVTLLWDLDSAAGKDAAPAFCAEDLFALIQLLEETQHANVASSALHFLDAAIELPSEVGERVELSTEQLTEMATRVVKEVCAHKHRLQDAAQYTLGALLGAILSDPLMVQPAISDALNALLTAVSTCKDPDQCQVLLIVLSSLAGNPRLLNILAKGTRARDAILQCGQNAGDQGVKARSLSLIKVLRSKDEQPAALSSSWYFGPEDDAPIPGLE